MAKAIEQPASGMVIGHAKLGVRFLGVDAPEVSFTLPGGTAG